MNEIDNINDALVRLGKALSETLSKALKSIQDIIDGLEPYQRYELLHPQKKPRGSIRRARKRGKIMTINEVLNKFEEVFPFATVNDYRPICHELFTDGKEGLTIWLKNGDVIEYYPKEESEE